MKSLRIVPISLAMSLVDYMGGTVEVPDNHDYVAVNKLHCANGETKTVITSYEVEPTVSNKGYYLAVPGTGSLIIGEVESVDPRGSLRKVRNCTSDEVIIANSEELALKMLDILESDVSAEEKIHAIFCPEHGTFTEFLAHTHTALDKHFDLEEAEESPAVEDAPKVRILNATGGQVPQEALDVLRKVLPIITGKA